MRRAASIVLLAGTAVCVVGAVSIVAQQAAGGSQFSGGTNPDGSLRPSRPVTALFSQESYTEYQLLEPGSEAFRIRFLTETARAGATEVVNATRGGSEGTGIEVYDPRTGKPLEFTYEQQGNDPDSHAIHAKLAFPVPQGGTGRVLIYKTYKDPRTYQMNGADIVWVRSLEGYRLGVVLPKGFAFLSSNVAAQVTTTADGRLKLAFANPSGQANPLTIHARPTTVAFPPQPFTDMFFDDVRTLYDLADPATGTARVEQTYSDPRPGASAVLDSLTYMPLSDLSVIDLDTAKPLTTTKSGQRTLAALEVPMTSDRQSAHLRLTGSLSGGFAVAGDELTFDRTVKGLRNTVLLPAGWQVSAVSQSGVIGGTAQGRAFVAFVNLNAENAYRVVVKARRGK
jgi:hypothetical protein